MTERRAFERRAHALLVHRVARLVQRREQRIAEIAFVHPRGDAHVAERERGAERMMREIEPPAPRVVAHALGDLEAEIELRLLREHLPQATVVRRRLIADGAHQRHKLAPQRIEHRADRGRGHPLVRVVDVRIGDVAVRREEARVFAAQLQRLFQIRHHRGEIVRRPRTRPGIVGGRRMRARTRDVIRRHLDRLLVAAPRDADQARIVMILRQAFAVTREPSSSLPISGEIHRSCARRESSATLPPARGRAALRHVGRLIPIQHGSGRAQIGDLAQPRLELGQRFLAVHAATSPPPP